MNLDMDSLQRVVQDIYIPKELGKYLRASVNPPYRYQGKELIGGLYQTKKL